MKIAFCTMEKHENRPPNSVGSSRIRGRWLWERWPEAEEYQMGVKYDAIIFQKAYWKGMLEEFEGIKIFDICDPDWMDKRPVVDVMNNCDAVVTSTETLAKHLRKMAPDKKIVCIPDRLALDPSRPVKIHEGRLKSVVWYGYVHNARNLDYCLEALKNRHIKLTVIADREYNPEIKVNYEFEFKKYDHNTIYDEIVKHDAVLLPKRNDYRGKFKSNNKIIQSWELGMPVILEPEDFDKYDSAMSRRAESEKRLGEVRDKYDVNLSVEEYKNLIEEVRCGRGEVPFEATAK